MKSKKGYSGKFSIKTASPLSSFQSNDYLKVYKELKNEAKELGVFIPSVSYRTVLKEIKDNFTPKERKYLPRWYELFKETLLGNGLTKALVYRSLIEFFFDSTHGVVHSLYILTAILRRKPEIGNSEVWEVLAVAHDIGRVVVSEIDKKGKETKESVNLRYLHHAELGAAIVCLLAGRFGLSIQDRQRLFWDVLLHDYAIEQASQKKEGIASLLTEPGRLLHDMEKLLSVGGKTPEQAIRRYIRRARKMASNNPGKEWYFMRPDLSIEDYLNWKMGLRGFSDNLAGMFALLKWNKKDFFTDFGKKFFEKWQRKLLPAILQVIIQEKKWIDRTLSKEKLYFDPKGRKPASFKIRKTLKSLQRKVVDRDKRYGLAYGKGFYTKKGEYIDPTIALPKKGALLKEVERRFKEYKKLIEA